MTAGKPEGTLETLAEWLSALRPGNRCPCCGAPLKEDWPRSREPRAKATIQRLQAWCATTVGAGWSRRREGQPLAAAASTNWPPENREAA